MNEIRDRDARRARTLGGRAIARVFVLGALAVGCVACDAKECTLVGCRSSVSTKLDLPLTPAELNGSRLEVCRNGQCGVFFVRLRSISASQPDQLTEVICSPVSSSGGWVECQSNLETTDTGIRVGVSYSVASPHDFTDGDRFRLRITDPSASVIFAQKEAAIASYTTWHPNGADCDGDYFCRSATF